MALAIQGKTIDQIAAFNAEFGVWIEQRLRQPVKEEISPHAFGGIVLYQAGNDFYALTERRLGFIELHLEGDEPATVSFTGVDLEVMQGNRLYVFSPMREMVEWCRRLPAAAFRQSETKPGRPWWQSSAVTMITNRPGVSRISENCVRFPSSRCISHMGSTG